MELSTAALIAVAIFLMVGIGIAPCLWIIRGHKENKN